MNREDADISSPPPYFLSMLNSLIRNDNILLRTEILNTHNTRNNCSEEFINNLEELTVDEEFLKKDLQCSICLEDFKKDEKYIILPCKTEENNMDDNHIFHSGCETCSGIKEWLKRNNSCPLCRKEFPIENTPISNLVPSAISITNVQEPIINPNQLENTLTDIITNYINEIEDENDERRYQMAIEASLNEQ